VLAASLLAPHARAQNGGLSPWLGDGDELALPGSEAPDPLRREVLSLLREYEAAYRARDIERLGRAWKMDAYERFVMAGLFGNHEELSMSVESGPVRSDGETVIVDFDQRTSRFVGSTGSARLRAMLARRSSGEWVLYDVRQRTGGAGQDMQAVDPGALAAAREFKAALESKDIERLAAVWSMTEPEQEAMRGVFQRAPDVRFQVDLLGLRSEGRHATLDFDQRFSSSRPQASDSALDRLRAQVTRGEDGRWVIDRLVTRAR
jgi:hypothetical protein